MPTRVLFAVLLLLILAGLLRPESKVAAGPEQLSFLYTAAKIYAPLAWMGGGERYPSGAILMLHDSLGEHVLVPHFAASADPVVSFDAQRVLFAGKLKAEDPWQIWEKTLVGGEPRRITSGTEDCIRPFYLPEDRISYARKTAGHFAIEIASLSGGKPPLVLTYGPADYLPTDILLDGRILFEAAQPLGDKVTPELYTVYSDGSGVESYRCDHGHARYSGKQVSSGDIVFATGSGLGRFTSTQAYEVPIATPAGEYAGEVAETSLGEWLVSWRAHANEPFRLMLWKPGAPSLLPVLTGQTGNALQPTIIRERRVPNRHPSGLHDWDNANLLALNAYTSKYKFANDSIRSVRFYTRDVAGNTKLLGTAPVERDGSFFVHVPTEQPLQIELLDNSGQTLKRESGFFWMRRGEQRVCVGCHAGPETAPENAAPRILLKSTTPTDLTGALAQHASGGH